MELLFTKMHGLSNDFVLIDCTQQAFSLTTTQIQSLADRHTGIGFDQMLIVEPAATEEIDFNYRIFNADGSEVSQCGNGARCLARFIHDKKLSDKNPLLVHTNAGTLTLELNNRKQVKVNMGIPKFEPEEIPSLAAEKLLQYPFEFDGDDYLISMLNIGNPHAVLAVFDIAEAPVDLLGPLLNQHPAFPEGINAGFMQIIDRNTIKLRVFERGSGETQACGSGACAAAVAGILNLQLDNPVKVQLLGGALSIEWQGEGQPVWMTGPAEVVFDGKIAV